MNADSWRGSSWERPQSVTPVRAFFHIALSFTIPLEAPLTPFRHGFKVKGFILASDKERAFEDKNIGCP